PQALIARLAAELNPLFAQLGDRRVEVVAHERELVLRRVARMDTEFSGRQFKDQLAVRRVVALDRVPAERVAQCLAQPLSLARVQEHMRADDRHAVMLRPSNGISSTLSERGARLAPGARR